MIRRIKVLGDGFADDGAAEVLMHAGIVAASADAYLDGPVEISPDDPLGEALRGLRDAVISMRAVTLDSTGFWRAAYAFVWWRAECDRADRDWMENIARRASTKAASAGTSKKARERMLKTVQHYHARRQAHPSESKSDLHEYLADKMGCSARTIENYLAEARDESLID